MVRSAAKNFRDVLVLVDPADYGRVLQALDDPGRLDQRFRFDLARKAFAHTAEYDGTIAAALAAVGVDDGRFTRTPLTLDGLAPDHLAVSGRKLQDLRYGENPHQEAALYGVEPAWGFGAAQVVQGKGLSFTNLLDLDAAARLALEFSTPAAVVIKHTNPCGVATAGTLHDAYVAAREVDPLSAFGGIVGLNRPLDADTAAAIAGTFIEAVVAPAASDEARAVPRGEEEPAARARRLRSPDRDGSRPARGAVHPGWPARPRSATASPRRRRSGATARRSRPARGWRVATRRAPTAEEWAALRFAWRVCAHVKSNTILFAHADRAAAVGAGQMSRVDAVKVATLKAGSLAGTVAASDAFFPFRDGIDAIAAAGATAVVQPGGSRRDAEVVAAADEHGLAMVFAGRRHFRH